MAQTTRTKLTNSPQPVLKSIQPHEEIAVNVIKRVDGIELEKLLQGVAAFTGSLGPQDQYEVTIRVEKLLEGVTGHDREPQGDAATPV